MWDESGGRRHPLSREDIIETALKLTDEAGLEKLSMRRLGAELGVDPMMIYRFFPNKAALLDGIMEKIWLSVDLKAIEAHDDWQEQLVAVMHRLRESFLAHPHAILIIGTRPAAGPGLFLLFDRLLGILVAAGMIVDDRTGDLLNALVNYTVGHVLAEVAPPVEGGADKAQKPLVPPALPHLTSLFTSGWTYDPYRQFDTALRAIVAGKAHQ